MKISNFEDYCKCENCQDYQNVVWQKVSQRREEHGDGKFTVWGLYHALCPKCGDISEGEFLIGDESGLADQFR